MFRSLRGFRRTHPARAALRGLRGQLFRSRIAKSLAPRKKTLPGCGPLLALAGADGAGKTSLAQDLRHWLSWKLLAPAVSLSASPSRRGPTAPCAGPARASALRGSRRRGRPLRACAARLEQRLRAWQWLWVARRRLARSPPRETLAERGAVIVADRYPLGVFHSMEEPMDGPRIRRRVGAAAERWAAREEALYARIGLPSRVLVLRTSLSSLHERKPGLDPAVQGKKASAVNAIEPTELFSVVDGDRRYQEVLLDLKRRVWSLL